MKHLLIIVSLILVSCVTDLSTVPEFSINLDRIEAQTTSLNDITKSNMNGVYTVLQGKDILGDEVVGRWIGRRWCLHAKHDVVYSENAGGSIGDSITLTGYIRVVRAGSGAHLDITVLPHEGGSELVSGDIPSSLILRGTTSGGSHVLLKRVRALHTLPKMFHVLGHRGGGRNSERLGISENSIAMLKHSEVLGATGAEIDVKRTRDGQLIVFHDDTFSPRTVQGSYLLGNVENFDLNQIKLFGRLIYGESIPTLAEALRAVIDSTMLSLVWLDIKDPSIIDQVIRAQQDAIRLALAKNRNVMILLGIPSENVLNAYRSSSLVNTTPILIELHAATALSYTTCVVWAPRWTNGIDPGDIDRLHTARKLVFTWTLDVREYIEDFLYGSKVDGILSNYPSLVDGMYYSGE